jgi:hypothetical protein
LLALAALLAFAGCHSAPRGPGTVVFHIKSSPANLARDLPAINLWYRDTIIVHNRRLTHVVPSPSGSYTFLETAELAN